MGKAASYASGSVICIRQRLILKKSGAMEREGSVYFKKEGEYEREGKGLLMVTKKWVELAR